jgi:hypothetical protein
VTATSYTIADLDSITGGVFHAATSGERAALLRLWLEKSPAPELMHAVFLELSAKDKGAAKVLREKLDDIKRSKNQDAIAAQWAQKAQSILSASRMQIADALAWQRDAAKAGAPLSKEPLNSLKEQLHLRVKQLEDLQHQAQVQREAAMMLMQRLEMLSTKPWGQAEEAFAPLQGDAAAWRGQAQTLLAHADWASADPKYPAQLDAATQQMGAMFEAFSAALTAAKNAANNPEAALPAVPVWAEEIRAARGTFHHAELPSSGESKTGADALQRKAATAAVRVTLKALEKELEEGHGKASLAAANAVRTALKTHGSHIDAKTDLAAQNALAAAAELEGWQRWRANQIRDDLIAQAQHLTTNPLAGRKQQEAIKALREQWKQCDQGGMANHSAWKHFDDACNHAHQVVEAWLGKVREQDAQVKTAREALLSEVQTWTTTHAHSEDWRSINRDLQQFAQRWRNAGHLGEKLYAQYQEKWKTVLKAAHAGIDAAQKRSMATRQILIQEALQLAEHTPLRIDAVKSLQARWQAEAQTVALERKTEQKLWDAFRQPIDAAFARKGEAREKAQAASSAHDLAVLAAVAALDAANAGGDAQQIRAAMAALQSAVLNPDISVASPAEDTAALAPKPVAEDATQADVDPAAEAPTADTPASVDAPAEVAPAPQTLPSAPRKPIVAMRGDDRPGAKSTTPTPAAKGFNRVRPERRGEGGARVDNARPYGRTDTRPAREQTARLSNTAFYAQRDALDRAQQALKKLSMQAHGEAIVQLLGCWQARDAEQLPTAAQLSKNLAAPVRSKWISSLKTAQAPSPDAAQIALLRLEMAADSPTPAEDMAARRQLQLQLLTQRKQATPEQTWGDDVATVLASAHAESSAKRLQAALAKLLH